MGDAPRTATRPGTAGRPVVLGLAGDSASGKSTLSRGIEAVFGSSRVRRVCTDDYHRYDRATRARLGITPLDPEANRLDVMAEHVRALAAGADVTKPVYDHRTGRFGPDETVGPAEVVIVEGLLPFVERSTRDVVDLAVFVDPDEELRRRWKLERDVFERGYSPAEVVAEMRRREPDAARFVRPQRDDADVVLRFHRRGDAAADEHLSARVTVRPTLPYPALRVALGTFRAAGIEPVRWSTRTDRRGPLSVLEIDGDCPADVGGELEDAIWSSMHAEVQLRRDRIGEIRRPGHPASRSEALALAQLLVVAHLVGASDGAVAL